MRLFIELPAGYLQGDSDSILRDTGIWGWILGSEVTNKTCVLSKWLWPLREENIGCYDPDPSDVYVVHRWAGEEPHTGKGIPDSVQA